ncbi:MAG: DNA cytosine methyltransferase [Actinomycetota bacterium]
MLTVLEVCAGAGGQAIGLEKAGLEHAALVEIDAHACSTLRLNRPGWNVIHADITNFDASEYQGVELLAGGVPCPPFSIAGKQLGKEDDRDLFPTVIKLTGQIEPRAVLIENVPGLLKSRFESYRADLIGEFGNLGLEARWHQLQAADFGVPQSRPRALLVALPPKAWDYFDWPQPTHVQPLTVGETLLNEMRKCGWKGAIRWAKGANSVAPTLVGGSKKHGGPDLGPTRARSAWANLGVNAKTLAEEPPHKNFDGMPRLTVEMAAIIQGFPSSWQFVGTKTQRYRQVGNAFPPPVAEAIGKAIRKALARAGMVAA